MRVCIYVCVHKYWPFVLLSPHKRFCKWFMTFGDNVSRFGSWQKNMFPRSVSCV